MLVEFCALSQIHISKPRFKQMNENLKLNAILTESPDYML